MVKGKGRRTPTDWKHVERYPFADIAPTTVPLIETRKRIPHWYKEHDQGVQGSCVGHGIAMERAIVNTKENYFLRLIQRERRYNPLFIWNEAKRIDEWPDTNPGDDEGTSVRAGYEIARTLGIPRVKTMEMYGGRPFPIGEQSVDPKAGVSTYRWATTVDQMRTAIASGSPITIGVTWYSSFDWPLARRNSQGLTEYWIGTGSFGRITGGHCLVAYAASDRRQAFRLVNSWGKSYPTVWIPYNAMQKLLDDYGEAALVTER